jgi:hypothetical protein
LLIPDGLAVKVTRSQAVAAPLKVGGDSKGKIFTVALAVSVLPPESVAVTVYVPLAVMVVLPVFEPVLQA